MTEEEILSKAAGINAAKGQANMREKLGEEEYLKAKREAGKLGGRPRKVPVDN